MTAIAKRAEAKGADIEGTHCSADDLLLEVLDSLGYGDGVQIFFRMPKWYA